MSIEKKNIKLLSNKVLILLDSEDEVVTKSPSGIIISTKKPVITTGLVVQRGPKTEDVSIGDRVEINPGITPIDIDGVNYILTSEPMIKYIIVNEEPDV